MRPSFPPRPFVGKSHAQRVRISARKKLCNLPECPPLVRFPRKVPSCSASCCILFQLCCFSCLRGIGGEDTTCSPVRIDEGFSLCTAADTKRKTSSSPDIRPLFSHGSALSLHTHISHVRTHASIFRFPSRKFAQTPHAL